MSGGPADVRRVVGARECRLVVGSGRWDFADRHRDAIDRHWELRLGENPTYFNGTIFVLHRHTFAHQALDVELMPVEFKSFLYWKETGYRDRSVVDAFGSALIRSADGGVVLGQQRAGNINAGLAYLPGGFIDWRDVDGTGRVDIAASIAREVFEETGLGQDDVRGQPGYLLTFAGPMLSIAVEYHSHLPAADLQEKIRRHIASQYPASELEDAVIVRSRRDLDAVAMPVYAEVLLNWLFAAT